MDVLPFKGPGLIMNAIAVSDRTYFGSEELISKVSAVRIKALDILNVT